ncbi:polysaccharide deacetylase [Bacillus sp. BHET2]|uniref:polysaccharide deacetylase family protein n=1 Tax=Bacillus sp. BHET2 TaxID=2583818 RepID=UPI00110E3308|nr:polysaccharide deacetylase family protein [Bacillus sp. BHET2]TMU84339.1 polysaccharide deacetylase [Bacillus sp. BHET2]
MKLVGKKVTPFNKKQPGTLVISLDFELYWGMQDQLSFTTYKDQSEENADHVVKSILECFEQSNIHATWAVVGFMFYNNFKELRKDFPGKVPSYRDAQLSPYHYLNSIKNEKGHRDFHFSPSLIQEIAKSENQEIGTHTFSHYYCLEAGQTLEEFDDDLSKAFEVMKKVRYEPRSIVFPRNQIHREYVQLCKRKGITSYRGTEKSWIYDLKTGENKRYIKRAIRFLDSYINLTGHNTYTLQENEETMPLNIPSSRFLRPVCPKLKKMESLRLKRILNDLTYAAKNGEVYHLWWHPHNFNANLRENIEFLNRILEAFLQLKEEYGMRSMNMKELQMEFNQNRGICDEADLLEKMDVRYN